MKLESAKWKEEVLGKTFIPGSEEERLVEETVRRIRELFEIDGHERLLKGIITVAIYDAYELTVKRIEEYSAMTPEQQQRRAAEIRGDLPRP